MTLLGDPGIFGGNGKKAGSPIDKDHRLNVERRNIKKVIKSEQRRAVAERKINKMEEIMNSKADSKMFAKLVKQQRKTTNSHVQSIIVNDIGCDTPEKICNGWATPFETLATPLGKPNFSAQHKDLVKSNIEVSNGLYQSHSCPWKESVLMK